MIRSDFKTNLTYFVIGAMLLTPVAWADKNLILNEVSITFRKNKYGDTYVTFPFKVSRDNSVPFLPGVVPRYETKPKVRFNCGENFEFFIRNKSLPFFRSPSKKGLIIARGTDLDRS